MLKPAYLFHSFLVEIDIDWFGFSADSRIED